MASPECRLVVLDLMGTTIADDGSIDAALRRTLAAFDCVADADALTAVRGLSKRDALRALMSGAAPARVDDAYAALVAQLRARWAAHPLRPAAGADVVLAALAARGIRLAITTGLDRDLAYRALDALGFPVGRLTLVCAADVACGRPAPDMIRRAMTMTGVGVPAMVACVGDTAADLRAAAAARVRWNIGVLGGAHGAQRLQAEPHTAIISGLSELPWTLGCEGEG